LEYATPQARRPRKEWSPFAKQLITGFTSFCLASVTGTVATSAMNPASTQPTDVLLAPGAAFILSLVAAGILRWRCCWRGFLPGALIGAGLTILGLGFCFAIETGAFR
jgi:hypothetical protein